VIAVYESPSCQGGRQEWHQPSGLAHYLMPRPSPLPSNSSCKIEQINVSISSKLMILSLTTLRDCWVVYKSLVAVVESSWSSSPDS
jgi:hypothetical protein